MAFCMPAILAYLHFQRRSLTGEPDSKILCHAVDSRIDNVSTASCVTNARESRKEGYADFSMRPNPVHILYAVRVLATWAPRFVIGVNGTVFQILSCAARSESRAAQNQVQLIVIPFHRDVFPTPANLERQDTMSNTWSWPIRFRVCMCNVATSTYAFDKGCHILFTGQS